VWQLVETDKYQTNFKKYSKKNGLELKGMIKNLDKYLGALESGVPPVNIKQGFIHNERQGVIAIDQSGGGPYLTQTRLYIYVKVKKETIYLLTIGNKKTQNDDIKYCIKEIRDKK